MMRTNLKTSLLVFFLSCIVFAGFSQNVKIKGKADPSHKGKAISLLAYSDLVTYTRVREAVDTIDADGFDPSIVPAVGTAEPNGLFWIETLEFLRTLISQKNVVGFDIVECAPIKGSILSEYTLAKLIYRLIGYIREERSIN